MLILITKHPLNKIAIQILQVGHKNKSNQYILFSELLSLLICDYKFSICITSNKNITIRLNANELSIYVCENYLRSQYMSIVHK